MARAIGLGLDMMLTRYAVAPRVFIACSSTFTAAISALPRWCGDVRHALMVALAAVVACGDSVSRASPVLLDVPNVRQELDGADARLGRNEPAGARAGQARARASVGVHLRREVSAEGSAG